LTIDECASVDVCLSDQFTEVARGVATFVAPHRYVISCGHVSPRGPHPHSRTMMMLTPLRAETLDVQSLTTKIGFGHSDILTYLSRSSVREVYFNDSKRN
jgi:hypothetical protein